MRRILDTILLPSTITEFERSYLARMNRIGLWFFLGHLPVLVLIAAINRTNPALAAILCAGVLSGPMVAARVLSNPRHASLVFGFTAMLMGGLLVHFGQGPIQIEMHFYFFVLIALLAVFGNPMAIVVAAATVALHHLFLWFWVPTSVFNYDAEVWVVAIHAVFVVLESVAACFIARSFFDNVIGLEKIVQTRTEALHERNRDMRTVLDNVEQGLLMLDRDGVVGPEMSAAVSRWFGADAAGCRFEALFADRAPATAEMFRLGWGEVIAGLMPLELTLEQLPRELPWGDLILRCDYRPVFPSDEVAGAEPELQGVLVILTDITAQVVRDRLQAEQREMLSVFEHVNRDRRGFVEFFEEADHLIAAIAGENACADPSVLRRDIHTLKGNSAIFGMTALATFCNEIETRMHEDDRLPSESELAALTSRWAALRAQVEAFVGRRRADILEVDDRKYFDLLAALLARVPHDELARMVADWRNEPIAVRLERFAEQARRIAARLGKTVDVTVDDGDISLDPTRWSSFWGSFIHAVRNAVDHGVEAPDVRRAKGKPERGQLILQARRQDSVLLVRIADDGAGIDWGAVADKATELGIPATTRAELHELLFRDGVTTRHEATEISGRGVGMGALRAATEALGGRVGVASEGQGTVIECRIPLASLLVEPRSLLSSSRSRTARATA
jgi:two-component system, chemotaxis family, sensor kinase CheA